MVGEAVQNTRAMTVKLLMVWVETGFNGLDFALVLLRFGGKWFFYQTIQFGLVSQEKWLGEMVWDTNSAEWLLCTSSSSLLD